MSLHTKFAAVASSGREVSACFAKQGAASTVMEKNPQTNIIYQGRTKF
jgi:hypothetical protein